jgi:hypothetical protein
LPSVKVSMLLANIRRIAAQASHPVFTIRRAKRKRLRDVVGSELPVIFQNLNPSPIQNLWEKLQNGLDSRKPARKLSY